MNGIDISAYQKGLDLTKINADFVIIKATEGTYMRQSIAKEFYAAAAASNKLVGFYHFAAGQDAFAEADYFVDYVAPYIGKALLALDWEGEAVKRGVSWAKKWLDRVYERTGIRPIIYMSKSVAQGWDWKTVAKDYALWGAQYASYDTVNGYQDMPWTDGKSWGAWGELPIIRQYTSRGKLPGWSKYLDLDKGYLTAGDWLRLAGVPEKPEEPPLKDIAEIAEEVLAGKWGNGNARREALEKAVYDYDAVQAEVNLLVYAREVLQGKWGNGAARKLRMLAAGIDYGAVQAKVNEMLGVSA